MITCILVESVDGSVICDSLHLRIILLLEIDQIHNSAIIK